MKKLCKCIRFEMKVLKRVRNKVSYIVKIEGDKGGLIMNMGYITVRFMTK